MKRQKNGKTYIATCFLFRFHIKSLRDWEKKKKNNYRIKEPKRFTEKQVGSC